MGNRRQVSPEARELQTRSPAVTPSAARGSQRTATPAATEARAQAGGRPRPAGRTHTKAAGLSRRATRDGRPSALSAPGPRSPRPLTPGSGGSWRATPCPRSASVSRGARLAAGDGRTGALRCTDRSTEWAARRGPRRPGAREGRREPGGGGEPLSGREATGGDGPEAEVATRSSLCAAPGVLARKEPTQPPLPRPCPPPTQRHFRRAGTPAKPRGQPRRAGLIKGMRAASAAEGGGEGTV